MKTFELKDGNKIPALGFGTWQLTGKEAVECTRHALETGYRHIDTADIYGNHKEVAKAIKSSSVDRADIFLTSKVFIHNLRKNSVIKSGERFLKELETDYLDLLLIHWPKKIIPIQKTLEGFLDLQNRGLIKSIGVSNFTIDHIENALEKSEAQITMNQVEFHPSLHQKELLEYCKSKNIVLTAYSPLATGDDLKLKLIKEIAEKYNKPESQVVLNWILEKGVVAIPKSANFDRIEENFGTLEWKLEKEDINKIDEINDDNRLINPVFAEF